MTISIRSVEKTFGRYPALNSVSLEIADGELMITDAEATAKSAPAFWREFEHLGGLAR